MQITGKQFFFSAISSAIFFAAVIYMIPPISGSMDDTFVYYMLGRGFPQATQTVTYYQYGFLVYEQLFNWLFTHHSSFNFLTAFYLLLHWLSCSLIACVLVSTGKSLLRFAAIAGYLFLFVLPLLIHLSYTSTAAHLIIAVILVFAWYTLQNKTVSLSRIVVLLCMAVAATALRAQLLVPLLAATCSFVWLTRNKKLRRQLVGLSVITLACTISFIYLHEKDYRQQIPRWDNTNATLQAVFQFANRGYAPEKIDTISDSNQQQQYRAISQSFFFYDSSLLDAIKLKAFYTTVKRTDYFDKGRWETLYWFTSDAKQPLFFMLLPLLLLVFFQQEKKYRYIALCISGLTVLLLLYLVFFMKLQERVWLPVLLLAYLLVYITCLHTADVFSKRIQSRITVAILLCLLFFQTISLPKLYSANSKAIEAFSKAQQVLSTHSDYLFIEYPGNYPFNDFPALLAPSKYSMPNIIFPFFFNTELKQKTLAHFGYHSIGDAFIHQQQLLFVGLPDPFFADYFYRKEHLHIRFEKAVESSDSLSLYKAIITP